MMKHLLLLGIVTVGLVALGAGCAEPRAELSDMADAAEDNWRPLWDGETFNGWHEIGEGDWTIEDGAIVGRHSADVEPYGHLVSNARFSDFVIRLKYKAIEGNSGFYFRIDTTGFSGISGFQAEIDPERDAGGLYETNGRAWVVQPDSADVWGWYRPNEWNVMTVAAEGPHIKVTVNGQTSAEIQDEEGRRAGFLALQVHGGQDVEVAFKDIEILEVEE